MGRCIFYNGKLYTMQVEGQEPWYLPKSADEIEIEEAMLIEGERIVRTGSSRDILKSCDSNTECIDLKGRCVIPAFNDSHCHILATGLNLIHLNLCGVRSCEEIIERGRKYISEMPLKENDWIVGYGFDQNIFDDPVLPDRKTAEAISAERPVFLDRICGHVGTVNQAALDIAGYDEHTVMTGGVLDKDEQGHLNGILREAALDKMRRLIPHPSEVTLITGLKEIMKQANSYGITSVQTDDLESTSLEHVMALYKKMIGKHEMTLRVYEEVQQPRVPQLQEFLKLGLRTGDGDEYFKIGNIKLLTDGSLGARTAYMSEEYADEPGSVGVAVYTQEALNEVVCLAHSSGMQIAFHAIGDGAVAQAVTAVEQAQKSFPDKKMRHRIVHCQFVSEDILDRMKAADIGADIQPPFTASDYSLVASRLGESREKWGYMWRTMAEKQIPMGGGSDSPVESMNPLWGIYCAVTRKDQNGEPEGGWHPDEKLTVSQAVSLYTRGSAYAEFSEKEKGQLLPGMLADFVVLSENIFEIPEKQLSEVQIEETYIGGKLCYRGK